MLISMSKTNQMLRQTVDTQACDLFMAMAQKDV